MHLLEIPLIIKLQKDGAVAYATAPQFYMVSDVRSMCYSRRQMI